MYFWVIMLFSLVTVMTYKMAGRHDVFDTKYAPSMEGEIASFVGQHKAALKYVENNPYTYTITGEALPSSDYEKYAPAGHIQTEISTDVDRYKSVVYCISMDTTTPGMVGECGTANSMDFLVTYGQFPEKWTSDEMLPYFQVALGRYTSRNKNIGFVEGAPPTTTGSIRGSNYVIRSVQGNNVYLPAMFDCVEDEKSALGQIVFMTQLTNTEPDKFVEAHVDGLCDFKLSGSTP